MKSIVYNANGRHIEIPEVYVTFLKPKYRKEIAAEYGLSTAVFRRRLQKHSIKIEDRGYLDSSKVLEIYLALGWPPAY